MQPSEQVLEVAGGAQRAMLNRFDLGDGRLVITQQVDRYVYVVGQDLFRLARYDLSGWLGEVENRPEPPMIECFDAEAAWELLQHVREDCLVWQCGACDAWIYTSERPRVGVLQCSTCADGGVDFRHADRHVGADQ